MEVVEVAAAVFDPAKIADALVVFVDGVEHVAEAAVEVEAEIADIVAGAKDVVEIQHADCIWVD